MLRSLAAFSLVALATALPAQEPPPILEASFEVASVKRNIDGGPTTFNPQATGQFTVINFPFATLITAAYQLQPYQLQDAPVLDPRRSLQHQRQARSKDCESSAAGRSPAHMGVGASTACSRNAAD
jgi:hypothetical protein